MMYSIDGYFPRHPSWCKLKQIVHQNKWSHLLSETIFSLLNFNYSTHRAKLIKRGYTAAPVQSLRAEKTFRLLLYHLLMTFSSGTAIEIFQPKLYTIGKKLLNISIGVCIFFVWKILRFYTPLKILVAFNLLNN